MARALHHLLQTFGRVALAVYSTWRNTAPVNAPLTDGSVISAFFFPPMYFPIFPILTTTSPQTEVYVLYYYYTTGVMTALFPTD